LTGAIEFLIHRGHKKQELLETYTMDEVLLFYEIAQKAQRKEMSDLAYAVRVAFGADKDEWRKFLRDMGVVDEPEQIVRVGALKGVLSGNSR
jgi:hypothetical protein